jgi:hypothetical protein
VSDVERTYYRAEGKSLEIAKAWLEKRKKQYAAQDALAEEYGGIVAPGYWGHMQGFHYREGEAPTEEQAYALRDTTMDCIIHGRKDKLPIKVPNKRRKAGQKLYDRMRELKVPTTDDLTAELAGSAFAYRGFAGGQMYSYSIVAEWIDDVVVLSVPQVGDTPPPEGAVKLKKSEYWQMKEAQDAGAEKVGA